MTENQLRNAIKLHQTGVFQQAEAIYVLAWHLLKIKGHPPYNGVTNGKG
jgi:hypothetical protein